MDKYGIYRKERNSEEREENSKFNVWQLAGWLAAIILAIILAIDINFYHLRQYPPAQAEYYRLNYNDEVCHLEENTRFESHRLVNHLIYQTINNLIVWEYYNFSENSTS